MVINKTKKWVKTLNIERTYNRYLVIITSYKIYIFLSICDVIKERYFWSIDLIFKRKTHNNTISIIISISWH